MNWNVRNAFVPGCVMRLKGDLWIVDVTVDGERGFYIGVEGIYFYTSICILFSLCYFWFWLCHWKEGWINQAKTSLSLIFLGSSGCCYLLWIHFFKKYFYFFYLWEISLIHWRPSLFKWGHWWPSVISPNPFNFVLPTKWHVPLISHCCHGHPIPIATKGLHRLTGRDVLRVNTHIRKQPLAMLKPSRSLWIIKGLVCFPPLTVMASNEIQ